MVNHCYMKNQALRLSGLLCLSFSFSGLAQDLAPNSSVNGVKASAAISGVLVDSATAEPVEYATVTLLQPASRKVLSATTTDLQGKFTLGGVLPGEYSLSFTLIGFQ